MQRIAIVGLGLIGSSVGMGLKRLYKGAVEIVGHDNEPTVAKRAQHRGAVDKVAWNLFSAVEGATFVILATPVLATRDLMELIGPHLCDGCVVTDTGDTKQAVMDWAAKYLPSTVSFIGGDPLIMRGSPGVEGAQPDIFQDALYCLIPDQRAHPDAVKLVTDMVKDLGGRPYFIDAVEHDSYAAAVNHLPVAAVTALVSTLSQSAGWRDISKQAALPFQDVTQLVSVDPLDNLDACIANKDALVHWLDQYIDQLHAYRKLIQEDPEGLGRVFSDAFEARERWLSRRDAGFPDEEVASVRMPGFMERMGDLVVGHHMVERYRRFEELREMREVRRRRITRE